MLHLFIIARPTSKGMVDTCDGDKAYLKADAVSTHSFTHNLSSSVGAKAATAKGYLCPHPCPPYSVIVFRALVIYLLGLLIN